MEVEIKAKIDDANEFIKMIEGMGARFIKEKLEVDWYFNHPCRDFAETDEALRIRSDNTLTYKGPKVDKLTKSREEHYISFNSAGDMKKILLDLGFKEVAKVEKRRKYYTFEDLTVCVDSVKDLGSYVEIECIGEYQPCKEKVIALANKLNIKNFERKSYLELVLQRGEM